MALCLQYDAYFDEVDDTWLEKQCSDKDCEYCKYKPEKPSDCKVNQNCYNCQFSE